MPLFVFIQGKPFCSKINMIIRSQLFIYVVVKRGTFTFALLYNYYSLNFELKTDNVEFSFFLTISVYENKKDYIKFFNI